MCRCGGSSVRNPLLNVGLGLIIRIRIMGHFKTEAYRSSVYIIPHEDSIKPEKGSMARV